MSRNPSPTGLSPDEAQTLSSVLDRIIPPSPDGRLPGAGELGLASLIAEEMEKAPELRLAVAEGLAALAERAGARGAPRFSALPAADQAELLRELETTQPGFLPGMTFRLYAAYYQHERVVVALGLEARPPYPKGYELEPGDPTLLDPVRNRPKLYREC